MNDKQNRKIMKITKEQMRKIKEFSIQQYKKNDLNHSVHHAESTAKLARLLAKAEKADINVCEAAAWLHDIAHHIDKREHPHIGAKIARPFLIRIGVNAKTADEICHAIISHASRFWNDTNVKEAKIVFDADHLLALGPVGFCRDFTFCLLYRKMKLIDAVKDTKSYVLSRYDKLKTKTAKKLGAKPQKLMKQFYKIFDEQESGNG